MTDNQSRFNSIYDRLPAAAVQDMPADLAKLIEAKNEIIEAESRLALSSRLPSQPFNVGATAAPDADVTSAQKAYATLYDSIGDQRAAQLDSYLRGISAPATEGVSIVSADYRRAQIYAGLPDSVDKLKAGTTDETDPEGVLLVQLKQDIVAAHARNKSVIDLGNARGTVDFSALAVTSYEEIEAVRRFNDAYRAIVAKDRLGAVEGFVTRQVDTGFAATKREARIVAESFNSAVEMAGAGIIAAPAAILLDLPNKALRAVGTGYDGSASGAVYNYVMNELDAERKAGWGKGIFVDDKSNHEIRQVDNAGTVMLVASGVAAMPSLLRGGVNLLVRSEAELANASRITSGVRAGESVTPEAAAEGSLASNPSIVVRRPGVAGEPAPGGYADIADDVFLRKPGTAHTAPEVAPKPAVKTSADHAHNIGEGMSPSSATPEQIANSAKQAQEATARRAASEAGPETTDIPSPNSATGRRAASETQDSAATEAPPQAGSGDRAGFFSRVHGTAQNMRWARPGDYAAALLRESLPTPIGMPLRVALSPLTYAANGQFIKAGAAYMALDQSSRLITGHNLYGEAASAVVFSTGAWLADQAKQHTPNLIPSPEQVTQAAKSTGAALDHSSEPWLDRTKEYLGPEAAHTLTTLSSYMPGRWGSMLRFLTREERKKEDNGTGGNNAGTQQYRLISTASAAEVNNGNGILTGAAEHDTLGAPSGVGGRSVADTVGPPYSATLAAAAATLRQAADGIVLNARNADIGAPRGVGEALPDGLRRQAQNLNARAAAMNAGTQAGMDPAFAESLRHLTASLQEDYGHHAAPYPGSNPGADEDGGLDEEARRRRAADTEQTAAQGRAIKKGAEDVSNRILAFIQEQGHEHIFATLGAVAGLAFGENKFNKVLFAGIYMALGAWLDSSFPQLGLSIRNAVVAGGKALADKAKDPDTFTPENMMQMAKDNPFVIGGLLGGTLINGGVMKKGIAMAGFAGLGYAFQSLILGEKKTRDFTGSAMAVADQAANAASRKLDEMSGITASDRINAGRNEPRRLVTDPPVYETSARPAVTHVSAPAPAGSPVATRMASAEPLPVPAIY